MRQKFVIINNMVMEGTEETVVAEPSAVAEPSVAEASPTYDLHIKIPREMQERLKKAAQLAKKLGDIPKADLVDLINLYIEWGMSIQKRKWLDRMGYK